jgi:hypothetical protein
MAGETVQSDKVASTVMRREGLDITSVFATHTLTTGQQETADIVQMVKVPKGATILDVILTSADIDSASSAVLAVGDAGAATRFIAGSTIGQAGGVERLNQFAGLNYEYTADDTIDLKVTTAPGTPVEGVVNLCVIYTMNQ